MNNKDLYSVRADDYEGQLRLAHLLQVQTDNVDASNRIDHAIEAWIERQHTNQAQFDHKCLYSSCPIERIPGTTQHFGCLKHLAVHECDEKHTIDQLERTKEGAVCSFTGIFIGQTSINIPTRQGIGTRSGNHFLQDSYPTIEGIIDDLFFNEANRMAAFQTMYKFSVAESRTRVIQCVERRGLEYECPKGHIPMADMLSMISTFSVPFAWTDMLTTRSYDEESSIPQEWIDLSRFRPWRTKIINVLSYLWSTMEEQGFNKSNVNRLREVCMYILYIIKFNGTLSIANTIMIHSCPPLLLWLPDEDALPSMPIHPKFKDPYDAQQFTSGKNLFTNFFANLVSKNPSIKAVLEESIKNRLK